jgi:transcriptional regulator with XRE-family HTH domain
VNAGLGARLRAARQVQGWSLREVERRTGIHNAHLAQIETGVIGRPAMHLLYSLAEVYQLDYSELLRLAGHVQRTAARRQEAEQALALHGADDLTPEEHQEVAAFLARLRRHRGQEQV